MKSFIQSLSLTRFRVAMTFQCRWQQRLSHLLLTYLLVIIAKYAKFHSHAYN
jgi:hypothetical protein